MDSEHPNYIKRYIYKGMVQCDKCSHFIPDIIGSGAGIGTCKLGIKNTVEFNEKIPLFRYSHRLCKDFNKVSI